MSIWCSKTTTTPRRHLARDFDAQWNDDGHHVLHVLLTGEQRGLLRRLRRRRPRHDWRAACKEGFIYQGEPSPHRGGKPRGTPSADLPPTAFVLFLQNHDQIGNRAFGERLTALANPKALEAAIALQLLCPQIPLLFMGEETGEQSPFLFFTDHNAELAKAVREGRRREFSGFSQFSDPALLAKLPDPNDVDTFERSKPDPEPATRRSASELYRRSAGAAAHRDRAPPEGARAVDAARRRPGGSVGALADGRRLAADHRDQSRRRAVDHARSNRDGFFLPRSEAAGHAVVEPERSSPIRRLRFWARHERRGCS